MLKYILLTAASWVFLSCSVSYKFNGPSTIDYSKTSSISIKDFPNIAPLVYTPLSQVFTETLKDKYTRQTKLQILRDGGDLDLEGEITGYNFTSEAVKADDYASRTRMTITIRVRYTNNAQPEKDFEQSFSAYQTFSNESTIDQVQDALGKLIIEEIVDQIYNATVADW
jgi:hypothetical protein